MTKRRLSAIKKSNDANTDVLKRTRSRVIEVRKRTNVQEKSAKISNDPFSGIGQGGKIVQPPYDMLSLTIFPEHNTEIGQCIETMEVNCDSFGHRFIPRIKDKPGVKPPKELQDEINRERVRLENFFANCTRESFVRFRRKLRKDYELTGNYYYEVIRNISNEIQRFEHMPSYQMRLGKQDKEFTKVERPTYEMQEDGSVKIVMITEYVKFRTYAQARTYYTQGLDIESGSEVVWFKSFGDPRIFSRETGEVDPTTPKEKQANEVIHIDLYSARSPYGLPRYIGNLLSIFGDRAAEEINYITFRNNNVPSMAVLVSNGSLTEGSFDAIESFVESQIQGSDNYSKFLIIEAEGDEEGEDGNQAKIDIKPLTSEQHKDALFQNYSKNNKSNVRRSWRLPPIFSGDADVYNKSTADTSRRLADEQIFAPERDEFDEMINRIIFPNLGILYHKYRSNSPNTTDNEQLVKMLATSEKTGGMTPFIARFMLAEILGRELPEFPEDFDPHVPFSLMMAEAVKNKADPTEPGQQVTAIKSDGSVDTDVLLNRIVSVFKGVNDPFVDQLTAIYKAAEENWSSELEEDHDHHEE